MISPAILALVLRARSPWLDDRRVRALSAAISVTVSDHGFTDPKCGGVCVDDESRELDEAAALIVIGQHESAWRYSVGTCGVEGLGGWGYFGVAGLWAGRFPGGTCGTPQLQARAALAVLRIGHVPGSWASTMGHYIGARSVGRHPEALRRARDWREVRSMLEIVTSTIPTTG